jgi:hypothetical protein
VGAGVEVLEEDGEGDDDFADFFLYDKWTFCFWLSGLLALVPGAYYNCETVFSQRDSRIKPTLHVRPGRLTILECRFNKTTQHHLQYPQGTPRASHFPQGRRLRFS